MNRNLVVSSPLCYCKAISEGNTSEDTQDNVDRKEVMQHLTNPLHFGLRAQQVVPYCCTRGAKSKAQIQRYRGQRRQKGGFSELVNPTGHGIAGPQVQHLWEIVPKICGTKRRQNGFFRARNPGS